MLEKEIFNISNASEFDRICLEVYKFQYQHNEVYQQFSNLLGKSPDNVKDIQDIPFLPIEFFKSKNISSTKKEPQRIFTSSGTTGSKTSKHFVPNIAVYEKSFNLAFKEFYGDPGDYTILALLPSYLEREGSSLIYMVDSLIQQSNNTESGFYLHDLNALSQKLKNLDASGQKILLIGVSFALLDLVESMKFNLKNTIVMETGGMKGRRKEMIRRELHEILKNGFGVD